MVASRGRYQMARGRHYAKLSLSNAARLSFSDLCILLFMFLSLCRLCVCVFLCSHWSLVDVPLIFFCPADHVPDWQPRVLLGMVEARSVNVKKTTTKQQQHGSRRLIAAANAAVLYYSMYYLVVFFKEEPYYYYDSFRGRTGALLAYLFWPTLRVVD